MVAREAAQSIGVELDIGKYAPAKERAHDSISMWAVDLPRFPTAMTGAPKQYLATSASLMMRIYEKLHPESRVIYEIVGDGPVWAFVDLEAAVVDNIDLKIKTQAASAIVVVACMLQRQKSPSARRVFIMR